MYFDLIYPWLQVNIAPDAASKLANDFSPAELEYFRKVVSCISYFVMLIILHCTCSLALYTWLALLHCTMKASAFAID